MMRLTADTNPDAVSAHVEGSDRRAALRTAEARADRLQRNARIRTGRWDLELAVETDHPPARLREGDPGPSVVISGDEVSQLVTDYPPREWDLLVQTVWVMHEVGHLRHTDFADLRDRLAAVPEEWRGVASQLWNAFEDGAVERAIRDRWPNYGHWLGQVRANLLASAGPGIPHPSGGFVYPMVHATVLGILDGLVYDSGGYERLLDPADRHHRFHDEADRERFDREIRQPLAEAVEAVGRLPHSTDRNARAFEFFERVRPAIEAAIADGRGQVEARPGDAWGMPNDAVGRPETGPVEPITGLEPDGEEQDRSDQGETSSDAKGPAPPPIEPMMGGMAIPTDEDAKGTEQHLLDALSEEVRDQERTVVAEKDSRVRNLEAFQAAVAAADADLESDGVLLPTDDPEPDQATAAAAHEDGTRLARVLRNRFQKRRRRRLVRNQRRGRLDPAALHRHATGETHLKHRRESPDDTDHHCLFVLDRSGSMQNHVRVAERAMGMLVVALEAVDVEVSVLELLDKEVRLAKPADRDAGRSAGRLFHGEATGGTPLSDTLHIARERLKREAGKRFLFVITDGLPADPDRYSRALGRSPFPVVGVNLSTDRAAGTREFHRQVSVEPETEGLRRALRQLVQEVLFE